MAQVRFKPATPRSRVHSTTELKITVILFLDIVMSSIKLVRENDIIDTDISDSGMRTVSHSQSGKYVC